MGNMGLGGIYAAATRGIRNTCPRYWRVGGIIVESLLLSGMTLDKRGRYDDCKKRCSGADL